MTEVDSAAAPRREYLSFSGTAQEYFRVWVVNVLLTALTLGVYSAWAKVRRRRYVYGHTTLSERRFDYHARPIAILRGRAIAVILLLIVLATQVYFPRYAPVVGTLIVVTIPWLIVRSRMFAMHNTSYSNIRFGFAPAYWESFRTVFFAGLLTVGTIGIGTPVAHWLRNRFVIRHTRYGNLPLKFESEIWDFFTAYLMTFVASTIIIFPLLQSGFGLLGGLRMPTSDYAPYLQWALPVLSALAAYYVVAQFLSSATLRPTLNGSFLCGSGTDDKKYRVGCEWSLNRLLFMYVINFVAIVCSLGLLIPWAQMRVTRYLVNGTWVELDDSLEQVVAQQSQQVSAVGEEIGSALTWILVYEPAKRVLFDGRSAKRRAVTVTFSEPGYITIQELGAQLRFPLGDVDVKARIGEQPAVAELPGNARLEVSDAEAFYAALQAHAGARQWQYGLESRWSAIAGVLLVTVAFGWFVYAQGVPLLAKWVAYAVPDEVNQAIGAGGLQAMDRDVFVPSTLTPDRRQRIRAAMQEVIVTIGGNQRYVLQFRGGGKIGANAYAFPSGVIVFTDELVRLAGSTNELRTIMAHEVGHVRNQHTLRMVLQKSLLAGLAVVITGDVSAVVGITAALPKILLEAGYSREFEYEADAVAKEYLLATEKSLSLFEDVMSRIAAKSAGRPNAPSLLKTHPATEERIKAFLD